ncbi:MAG: CAP domain-containing protein [Burkholderiales bacterium]|nr:CAP domain-containing protein [Burkholderiales bacterium]MDE2398203.1 CAP domain-containing protein [Burkholderiales bacterium]MDE2452989.1 CAP domain-containing protein [Burkholderiales bacterium]
MPYPRRLIAATTAAVLALAGGAADAWRAAPASATPQAFSLRVLEAINLRRERLGLGRLDPDPGLERIADDHNHEMAAAGRLSHAGFDDRFGRTSSRLCVEDLAAGFTDATTLVQAWTESPAHRRNLDEPHLQRAGIAFFDGYVTYFACE